MKLINWISLLVLVVFISVGAYSVWKENKVLSECSNQVKGLIVDKYKINKRGYFIKYKYEVEGSDYFASVPIKGRLIKDLWIGTSINVSVSCQDPNVSEMISNVEHHNIENVIAFSHSLYERINELPFVEEKTLQLKETNLKPSFFTKEFPEDANGYHLIQFVTSDELRMTPLFNFHYYSAKDSLLYLDVAKDSLILIEKE